MGVLIRFKGGCGGEFLKTLLAGSNHLYHASSNRFTHHSAFNCLLNHGIDGSICDRYGLPYSTCWEDLKERLSNEIVSDLLRENPEDAICMHFVFRSNFDHGLVFKGYDMVDLYPSVGSYWVTQALQIYKAAFVRITDPLPLSASSDHRYHRAKAFRERNGWIPAWWNWVLREPNGIDLEDVGGFLDWACSSEEWEQTLSRTAFNGNELTVLGERFVVDTDAVLLSSLFERMGAEASPAAIKRMGEWALRNLRILREIGLEDRLGEDLVHERQKTLLKDCFLPIYEDLVFRG